MDLRDAQNRFEQVLRRTGDSPETFAKRAVGMTSVEMAAGVPKWGWLGVGIILGAAVTYTFAPRRNP